MKNHRYKEPYGTNRKHMISLCCLMRIRIRSYLLIGFCNAGYTTYGDKMQKIGISVVCLFGMVKLGELLQFIETPSYLLYFVYVVYLLGITPLYKANCKPLEKKDFWLCAIFVFVLQMFFIKESNLSIISYWYLSVYIAHLMYACSLRYKSLY